MEKLLREFGKDGVRGEYVNGFKNGRGNQSIGGGKVCGCRKVNARRILSHNALTNFDVISRIVMIYCRTQSDPSRVVHALGVGAACVLSREI